MILVDNKKVNLTKKDYNIGKNGRLDERYASRDDSKVHIFSRPERYLPKKKAGPERGSKIIISGSRSYVMDPFYTVIKDGVSSEIRYAETVRGDKNNPKYSPDFIEFGETGKMSVSASSKPEKFYFMYNHPGCSNGPNFDPSQGEAFFLVDRSEIHRKEIEEYQREQAVSLALSRISDDDALKAAEIIGIATTKELAKVAISKRYSIDPSLVFKVITGMTADPESFNMVAFVNELNKYDIAAFNARNKAWYTLKENRAHDQRLVDHKSTTEDAKKTFIAFLEGNQEWMDKLTERLNAQKLIRSLD